MANSDLRRKSSLPTLPEPSGTASLSILCPEHVIDRCLAGTCLCNPSTKTKCDTCACYHNRICLSGSFDKHYHSDTELLNPKLQEYFWQEKFESTDILHSSKGSSFSESFEDPCKKLLCLSDKTLDCGSISFQYSSTTIPGRTFSNHRRCRLCFRERCYGCRYFIGYSKVNVVGLRSGASLPNISRGPGKTTLNDTDAPGIQKKFTKNQKISLFCIGFINITAFLSMSIIAPFFPYEASLKNMRDSVSGLVFSVYALVTMLACPIFGKLAPHVGVKFMYLSGIFVSGVSNILFGMLVSIDDEIMFAVFCFVVRSFEALGAAAFSTAANIIIINSFPDDIGTVFGLMETCVGIGMSLGPALGGGLYSVGGYGLPFYILGSLVLVGLPINCWFLNVTEDVCDRNEDATYKNLLSVPLVIIISIVVVVASQAQGFIDPTLEPHLRKEFGLDPGLVGLLFLLMSAAYAVFSPIVGYATGKYEIKYPMMLGGLTLMTVSLLLLGPSPFLPFDWSGLPVNIFAIVLLGISLACAYIPTFEAILNAGIEGGLPDDIGTYGIVSGLWTAMYSLGEVIGPTLGGVLADFLEFPQASTTMAICCFLTALLICGTWLWSSRSVHAETRSSSEIGISERSSERRPLMQSPISSYGSRKQKL